MPHSKSPFDSSYRRPTPLFIFHWIAFFQGFRREKTLMPPNVRDGASFAEVGEALVDRGGRYGTLFLNRSSTKDEYNKNKALMQEYQNEHVVGFVEDAIQFHPVDTSFLAPGDTAVITTRLMWNDLDWNHRLHLHGGFTTLLQGVVRETRPYFPVGRRGRMMLSPEIADQFPPEYSNRGSIEYHQRQGAWYKSLGRVDGLDRRCEIDRDELMSAAYIVHLPAVECLNGANLLLVFGMGATQTLAISHRLRTDLGYLLDRWGFSMVEMRATPEPEHSTSLDWVKDWEMNVLLQTDVLD